MPSDSTPGDFQVSRQPPPEPGVYRSVAFAEYAAWDAANAGILRAMAHAPAMALYRREHVEHDRPTYLLGRLFHLLTTQPDLADGEFIVKPETYVNDKGDEKPWHGGAKVCKAWMAEQEATGRSVVSAAEMDQARQMAENIRAHPKLGQVLQKADVEVSVVWVDETTGVTCKGRYDVARLDAGIIGDLKSCQTAKPDAWFADAYRHKYHIQTAMYVDAGKALGLFPEEVPWFVFALAEKYPPYLVRGYDVYDDPQAMSYAFLDLGRKTYKTLLQQYAYCLKNDEWPGYGDEHADMMLPPWVKDAEDFEMR